MTWLATNQLYRGSKYYIPCDAYYCKTVEDTRCQTVLTRLADGVTTMRKGGSRLYSGRHEIIGERFNSQSRAYTAEISKLKPELKTDGRTHVGAAAGHSSVPIATNTHFRRFFLWSWRGWRRRRERWRVHAAPDVERSRTDWRRRAGTTRRSAPACICSAVQDRDQKFISGSEGVFLVFFCFFLSFSSPPASKWLFWELGDLGQRC